MRICKGRPWTGSGQDTASNFIQASDLSIKRRCTPRNVERGGFAQGRAQPPAESAIPKRKSAAVTSNSGFNLGPAPATVSVSYKTQ